jgi:HKD family nuclease
LRGELAGCDQADILVSFITHSGVRKLLDILPSVTAVGAAHSDERDRLHQRT